MEPFRLTGIRRTGEDEFELAFTGTEGQQYMLQEATSLMDAEWMDVDGPFLCHSGTNTRVRTQVESQAFWRLKEAE